MRGSDRFTNLTKWDQWQYHNYFRDHKTGRLAIADDSGQYPDETDDGVLFVDFSRGVKVIDRPGHRRGYNYRIPLLTEKGEKTGTVGSDREVVWLKSQGMRGKILPESITLVEQGA